MKRVFSFILLYLCVIVVYGTAHCDTIKVDLAFDSAYHISIRDDIISAVDKSIAGVAVSAGSEIQSLHENDASDPALTLSADSFEPWILPSENSPVETLMPEHRFAVKTNLLYDPALMLDLEVEWRFNRDWSVALEGDVAWLGNAFGIDSYRLVMASPEVRRWFCSRGPWHGFYAGLFVGAGYYDLKKGNPGYYGDGFMGGLSVGFMWPVTRCLSFEAGIGAGYLHTRYKEYLPLGGHHVYQRTKDLNYFGPLKVKLSLVWRLFDINKSGRRKVDNKNTGAL